MPNKLMKLKNNGVTLVEVMIALTILLIVFMGLIQASIVAVGANMRNEIRDEAVRRTSDLMSALRASPFDDINRDNTADPANPTALTFTRNQTAAIRNASVPYALAVSVTWLDADHKQIQITTTWSWQGETLTHQISAFRGRT